MSKPIAEVRKRVLSWNETALETVLTPEGERQRAFVQAFWNLHREREGVACAGDRHTFTASWNDPLSQRCVRCGMSNDGWHDECGRDEFGPKICPLFMTARRLGVAV